MVGFRFDDDAAQQWRGHWPVVLAAAAGMALASVPTYTMGVMLPALQREFGWTRAAISSGPMIPAILAVPLGPVIGWAVDRFGPRRIGIAGVAAGCIALAMLATARSAIWTWWMLWTIVALATTLVKPAVWAAAVSSLFTSTRGLALAAMLCGTALASTMTPALTNFLVESHGWRAAYLATGALWAVVVLPPVFFFFSSASDSGRDKRRARGSSAPAHVSTEPPGIPARRALTSWRYVRLCLASVTMVLATVTYVVSLVPILVSLGHPSATAAAIAGLVGVTTVVGRLFGGYLLDRLNGNAVAAFTIALPIIPCLLLLGLPASLPAAIAAVMILGASLGAELDAVAYLTTRHFGLRSFGVLFGTIGGLQALATGLGPLITSYIFDLSHSYRLALWLFIPTCVAGAALFLSLGPYPEFGVEIDATAPEGGVSPA